MSVRTLATVWECSCHSGTDLLMLLAIADFADDNGRAYPSVAGLADKCRMTPRNANYILAGLQQSGELRVLQNQGPKGKNLYQIVFSAMTGKAGGPLQVASGVKGASGLKGASPLKPASSTPEAGFPKPLKPASAEPSLNRQEPSGEPPQPPFGVPACPHRKLLTLFAETVPALPKPRAELWDGSSAANDLAARWKWVLTAKRADGERYAETIEEAMAWFARFFGHVASSDFLTGRSGRWKKCNLQWLVKRENFTKVVEGHYENDEVCA